MEARIIFVKLKKLPNKLGAFHNKEQLFNASLIHIIVFNDLIELYIVVKTKI